MAKQEFYDPQLNKFWNALKSVSAPVDKTPLQGMFVNSSASGGTGSVLYGGKFQTMEQKLAKANKQLESLGGKPESQKRKGFWMRALDVLSRPNYAVAEGMRNALKDANERNATPLSQLSAFGSGFGSGFTGKQKTTFSKVIKESDLPEPIKKNRVVRGIGGFALDVGLDPTTYLGFGLVSKGAKATAKTTSKIDEILHGVESAGVKIQPETRRILTGEKYVAGAQSQKAAAGAQAQVIKEVEKLAKTSGVKKADAVRADLLAQGTKPLRANQLALAASKTEEAQVLKNITTQYQNLTLTKIPKTIGIGAAGQKGFKIPVVPFNVAAKIKTPDVIKKAQGVIEKTFKNSAGP